MEEPVYFGDSIQLSCHVSKGDRPLHLSWTFHGKEPLSDLGIVTTRVGEDTSLLTVPLANTLHTGNYTCIASNRIGKTSSTAEILVNGISFNDQPYRHLPYNLRKHAYTGTNGFVFFFLNFFIFIVINYISL